MDLVSTTMQPNLTKTPSTNQLQWWI